MSNIDPRVVQMQFDNKEFEAGVKTTMGSLDSLNKSLKMEGATKGLENVGAAARNLSLGNIEQNVSNIADRFRAMSIVAITALTNIATRAYDTGVSLIKSLTVDPVKSGLSEYETNLNSIQTILSNTQWQNTGLDDVNKALQILNTYSDQTIYNFSEMARNIGTFTAAGVKLEVATNAIKGIANLAAVSGSNAEQASTAMYQLSQALAAGKVALMDWNSVVNAGMGGKVFQDALMETARVHHVAIDKMVKDAGSFRNTLENGWLTGQILTETLAKFTGDLTAAQLKAMGYNDQQIVGILKMGKNAQDAATKVKTLSQLISTLQEAAGSGWTQTWQLIFGDFEEARTMFTNVNNVLGKFISASADARNQVIGDWKELGGRADALQSIENVFTGLIGVVVPIRDAFREMFPATTGAQLAGITRAIKEFTDTLTISSETADKLRRTFAGVFAIFGIGWDIVKEAARVLAHLFGVALGGSGDFLTITANIGDFLVALRQAIKDGNALATVFVTIGKVLEIPIKLLKAIVGYAAHLFDGFDAQATVKSITGAFAKLEPFTALGNLIAAAWSRVGHVLGIVGKDFLGLGSKLANSFGDFGTYVATAFRQIDWTDVLKTVDTGLFAGLVLIVKNAFGKNGTQGLFHSIKKSFDELTGTLNAMQNTLRAATLLQIAAAIAVLTISVVAMSKIDSDGLTRALAAMTVMFTELFSALLVFEKVAGFKGLAKMPFVTASLIALAIAIDILTIAVKQLSELDWQGLSKGLTGFTVLLTGVVLAVRFLPPSPGIISTSIALIFLAGAIKLLVSSVTDLSGLSWQEMAKGLTGVAAVLAALTLFTRFAALDKGGIFSGAGIVLLAVGIKILASAMKDFSTLSWQEIGKGLTAMAGGLALIAAALILIPPSSVISAAGVLITASSLGMIADAMIKLGGMKWSDIGAGLTALAGAITIIGLAISLIPPTAALSAAGILIVAASLEMIVVALQKMGGFSWEQIGKSLTTLAGALGIIAVALNFMTTALPGAAAVLVVAGALAILAPILQMFGQMSWTEIGKGLLTLAGVFLVLGLAGALLTPVVPTLLGLGAAILLIGVGLALAGAGILAFSIGVAALSISGAALVTTIVAIVAGLIGLIPSLIEQIGLGLVALAGVIGNAGPAITKAIGTLLLSLLQAIIDVSPKIEEALLILILLILAVLIEAVPRIAEAGFQIMMGILKAIRDHIQDFVGVSLDIVANFIKGLGDGLPKVLQAGADFIIKFINGLADTIRNNSDEMGKAGGNLATAIIEGIAKGLFSGASVVAKAAKDVAKQALQTAKDFLGIKSPSKRAEQELGRPTVEGMAVGLDKYSHVVAKSAENVGKDAMDSLRSSLTDLHKVISGPIDMTPTITPVLDLTSIRRDAEEIGKMLTTKTITLDTAYSKAKDASRGFDDNRQPPDDPTTPRSGDTVFYQYNTSPKALSDGEIYRQTKNLVSVAREAVTP